MSDPITRQRLLQQGAAVFLRETPTLALLGCLGTPIQTGSSVTGLMVYPDIDFSVQCAEPRVQDAIDLTSRVFSELGATMVKVADFGSDDREAASYYIGFDVPYGGETWHIDATVTTPAPIVTNPPELAAWLDTMTDEQRNVILTLKRELIDAHRYVGSRSQPPYTFRSVHLYEGVLQGGASSIAELEQYFGETAV